MGGQRETLTPSRLKYTTLSFHQTNDTELKSTIKSNASIYNNTIDYL